jgi:hypothetical protein
MKRYFKSKPLDLEGCIAKDQCIIDSQLEEAESRGDRTREFRTCDSITTIDHEKSMDYRYGPEEFVYFEIEKEE